MTTLWKISENDNIFKQTFESLGKITEVKKNLISIKTLHHYYDSPNEDGPNIFLFQFNNKNTLIQYKTEPEFGSNEVFSLHMNNIFFEKEFLNLYVQIYELLGCVIIYNKEFVYPKQFRKLVNKI